MDVSIRGESIKLGQFLKLANLAETGGHAKELIAEGKVVVNGEVVDKRGHTLYDDDLVEVAGVQVRVLANDDGGDDYFDERFADDDFDPEKWRNL